MTLGEITFLTMIALMSIRRDCHHTEILKFRLCRGGREAIGMFSKVPTGDIAPLGFDLRRQLKRAAPSFRRLVNLPRWLK